MGDKAVVGVADDVGEGMQCVDHPYRSNPGGVCAFCLQEKLGKLVSSSKSTPFFPLQALPSSSSSSPTSFRSDVGVAGGGLALPGGHSRGGAAVAGRRTKFPFLAASHSKKKKIAGGGGGGGSYGNGGRKVMASVSAAASGSAANDGGIVLKRSKSVAPRTAGSLAQGGGGGGGGVSRFGDAAVADSPRKKSFWSFLYHSSTASTSTSSSSVANNSSSSSNNNINRRKSTSSSDVNKQQQSASDKLAAATAAPRFGENVGEEIESPSGSQASSSFGRKVARSRSVGCGSRSFSGDFLERISTGFGDCTLRRVESQREAKPKIVLHLGHDDGDQQRPRIKERVKCGGLFGGFGMMSAYWLSAAAADDDFDSGSRTSAATPAVSAARGGATPHSRTRSWGLAFASPMRAFRPYSSSSKSLYAINTASPAAQPAATNFISSIDASSKMVNGGGKGNKLDGSASSFLAVQS